jgi:hypothetical protein
MTNLSVNVEATAAGFAYPSVVPLNAIDKVLPILAGVSAA